MLDLLGGTALEDISIEDRVTNGIVLLDVTSPGWRDKVNIDDLNMRSGADCILGQIYGSYTDGVNALWSDWDSRDDAELDAKHGFDEGQNENQIYDLLHREWVRRLTGCP